MFFSDKGNESNGRADTTDSAVIAHIVNRSSSETSDNTQWVSVDPRLSTGAISVEKKIPAGGSPTLPSTD